MGQDEEQRRKERERKAAYRARKKVAGAESGDASGAQAQPAPSAPVNEPGVVETFAERGGAAVPPSTTPEPHPEQVVGPGDPELPRDVVEAAGRRLENEPLPEEVVSEEEQKKLAWQAELERAFESGYVGEPAPYGSASPMKLREAALTTEWARGVWARQAEQMREANEPAWKLKQRAEMKKKGSSWD